jgi:hypothetical protein
MSALPTNPAVLLRWHDELVACLRERAKECHTPFDHCELLVSTQKVLDFPRTLRTQHEWFNSRPGMLVREMTAHITERLQDLLREVQTKLDAPPTVETKTAKKRGRKPGIDKIGEAVSILGARLKNGESISISAIARQAGCRRENLSRNNRFQDAYRELTAGMTRAARARGEKREGDVEAWIDPRGDRDGDV